MALPEKSAAANQPRKVYPALVVVNVVGIDSAVLVVTAVTAVPKLVLKVTVRSFAVHLA